MCLTTLLVAHCLPALFGPVLALCAEEDGCVEVRLMIDARQMRGLLDLDLILVPTTVLLTE